MSIGTIISDSLKYPFSNIKRAFGLLLLFLGSILIIPAFLALGYNLRIIENTINGSNELPPFDEWGNMFIDGLRFFAVTLIFLIIPDILMIYVIPWILATYFGIFQISNYLLSNIIGLLVTLPFNLAYIMALGNMAHEVRFGAAFEFNKIFGFIKRIGWPKYVMYIIVFALIDLLLSLIPDFSALLQISLGFKWFIVDLILLIGISIYLSMYRGRFIGLMYREGQPFLEDNQKIDANPGTEENKDIGTI